tara:strand:+ start:7427 stop:8317 length:891 start_codon:yes stop_codon:yes gene_type:complete
MGSYPSSVQDVFSHSSLSSYENCPRKYAFRYIEKIQVDTEGIEAFVGKRVHEILERLYQFVDDGVVPPLPQVLKRYEANFDDAYNPEKIRIVRNNLSISHYRAMGAKGIENFYRRHYPFDSGETLGLERPIRFNLDENGQYRIRGIIDRLARAPDGAIEIHDYKTSARMPAAKYLRRDRQLSLYEIAIRDEGFEGEIRLVWWYVTPNRMFVTRRNEGELNQVKTEVTNLIDAIRTETLWEPRKGPLCSWCEYKEICPLFRADDAEKRTTHDNFEKDGEKDSEEDGEDPSNSQLSLL